MSASQHNGRTVACLVVGCLFLVLGAASNAGFYAVGIPFLMLGIVSARSKDKGGTGST